MATDQLLARDAVIRQAAFDHVRTLQNQDLVLSHETIANGVPVRGKECGLKMPRCGFTSGQRAMPFLLSIRTVFPRRGGRVWYDDQLNVHRQILRRRRPAGLRVHGQGPSSG